MASGSLHTARSLVFALALITISAIAYLSNRAWLDYVDSRNAGQAASQATQVNQRLLGWIRDAETGQRGYLLTGLSEYLQPYRQAQQHFAADLDRLRQLQAGNARQQERIARLQALIADKMAELRVTVQTYDAQGVAAAMAIVATGHGKRTMDEIRGVAGEIDAGAQEQLALSRNNVRRHSSQARLITLGGCAALFVFAAGAFVANERSYRHREALIRDLAEANRASNEIRELLRTTFNSIGDGVISTDGAGNVKAMNPAAERFIGLSEAEAYGTPVGEAFRSAPAASRRALATAVRDALHNTDPQRPSAPLPLREESGAGPFVEAAATAIRDAAGKCLGAVLVLRDVTERARSEERLRQAAKLESLGVLAGGIAHDFNNILVGIVGNASLLEEYLPPGSPGRDLIETLQMASSRAARLTNQMLAYSGRGKFVVSPVDLSKEVWEIASLVQASIPKNVELRLRTETGLPMLDADASQLQQLIMNLAINGAEAVGKDSGYVEIATGLTRVAADSVTDVLGEALPQARYIVLEVRDSGHGMDEATRARIFDPFFTTKFTGRGLGLAAALGIVKGHGGAIQVESAPGRGACFRVYFPAAHTAGSGKTNDAASTSSAGDSRA